MTPTKINQTFDLPELEYSYDDLQPSISADIMKLHHQKHHQGYVDKLNDALKEQAQLADWPLQKILGHLDELPESIRQDVRNNGGGHYNHSLFWQSMSPQGGGEAVGATASLIDQKYGDFQGFVDQFSEAAAGVFGSGWAWLMPDGQIITSPNQDSPLMTGEAEPLLGLDVWEHAYYLDYFNKRADYIKAWWDVVNWEFVEERLSSREGLS